jgi:DNA-binding CsgD family transcriptional regulator
MALVTYGRRIGATASAAPILGRLTPRETDVLAAMAEGRTNAAIAETLFLSRRAIEKHINSIFSKLALTGDEERHPRVHAVLIYLTQTAGPEVQPSAVVSDVSTGRLGGPRHSDWVHFHQHAGAGRRRNLLGHCVTAPMLSCIGR